MKRHLIYHLCPLKANDGWLENLDQLSRRIDMFDGERIIAVAQGDSCVPLIEVKVECIGYGLNVELAPMDNDPAIREVASFKSLLMLARQWSGAVFYAHSKGNSTVDGMDGARAWRDRMYERLLCERTEPWRMLEHYKAVGACKMTWDAKMKALSRFAAWRCPFPVSPGKKEQLHVPHQWMFAGTFFWFRASLIEDGLAHVHEDRYGAEGWLGQFVESRDALSVYQPAPEHKPWNPYDARYYDR